MLNDDASPKPSESTAATPTPPAFAAQQYHPHADRVLRHLAATLLALDAGRDDTVAALRLAVAECPDGELADVVDAINCMLRKP